MKMLVENDYIATFLADEKNHEFFFKSFHKDLVLRFDEFVTVRVVFVWLLHYKYHSSLKNLRSNI